eukprot:1401125-Rhodomonas_salina.1
MAERGRGAEGGPHWQSEGKEAELERVSVRSEELAAVPVRSEELAAVRGSRLQPTDTAGAAPGRLPGPAV